MSELKRYYISFEYRFKIGTARKASRWNSTGSPKYVLATDEFEAKEFIENWVKTNYRKLLKFTTRSKIRKAKKVSWEFKYTKVSEE